MLLKTTQTGQLFRSNMEGCPIFIPVKLNKKIIEELKTESIFECNDLVRYKNFNGILKLYLTKFVAGDKNTTAGFADIPVDELFLWNVAKVSRNVYVKDVCNSINRFNRVLDDFVKSEQISQAGLIKSNTALRPKSNKYGIRKIAIRAGDPKTNPNAFYRIPPELINEYLEGFINFVNSEIPNDLYKALIVFQQFIFIHPFNDGNGRLSRLLFIRMIYKKHGFIYAYIFLYI